MTLKQEELDLLRLVKRSENLAVDGGWIKVSTALVSLMAGLPDKLAETMEKDGDTFTRLTPEGQTVIEYV